MKPRGTAACGSRGLPSATWLAASSIEYLHEGKSASAALKEVKRDTAFQLLIWGLIYQEADARRCRIPLLKGGESKRQTRLQPSLFFGYGVYEPSRIDGFRDCREPTTQLFG
jgi:hypothetical protein